MVQAVESGKVGLGQLFRYLGYLPSFRLLTAEKGDDGSLRREYILAVPQLRCRFLEIFAPGFTDSNSFFDNVIE